MVQPKHGEIDYSMAEQKPAELYSKVMGQKIVEHKVSKETQGGLKVKSRVTTREISVFMLACEKGLTDMLLQKSSGLAKKDLVRAMSHEKTREVV